MTTSPALLAVHITSTVLSMCILFPIELYYTYKVYQYRNCYVMIKRQVPLMIVCFVFGWLSIMLYHMLCLVVPDLHDPPNQLPLISCFYFATMTTTAISYALYVCRLWLIRYVFMMDIEAINHEWQKIINADNFNRQWFLRNKSRFGSWSVIKKYCIAYLLLYLVVVFLALAVAVQADFDERVLFPSYFLFWLLVWIPIILVWVLLCKAPAYHDNVGLIWEFKLTAKIFTIWYTVAVIVSTMLQMAGSPMGINRAFTSISSRCMNFAVIMAQTYMVLRRFRHQLPVRSDQSMLAQLHSMQSVSHSDVDPARKKPNQSLKMVDVLQDDAAFDLFVKHCSDEHCLECILSVIEFLQFKKKLNEAMSATSSNGDTEQQENSTAAYLNLPDSCPQSDIVYNNGENYKLMARLLFLKYIKTGTEWEINISFSKRAKYFSLMNDENQWMSGCTEYEELAKLQVLFDTCIEEMLWLIEASFIRFTEEEKFQLFQKRKKGK